MYWQLYWESFTGNLYLAMNLSDDPKLRHGSTRISTPPGIFRHTRNWVPNRWIDRQSSTERT